MGRVVEYPAKLNRETFKLGYAGSPSCLGGGCEEDVGRSNSFTCGHINDCVNCILCTAVGSTEEALKWLLEEEYITKKDILQAELDGELEPA